MKAFTYKTSFPWGDAGTRAKSGRGQQMRANAPGLQNSAVVVNLQVRQSVSWTDFVELEVGGCGEDVSIDHTVKSDEAGEFEGAGPLAQEHSNLASKLSNETYTLEKNFKGVPDKRIKVEVRNRVMTFIVRKLPSMEVLETSEVYVKPIQFRKTLIECHNGGGE